MSTRSNAMPASAGQGIPAPRRWRDTRIDAFRGVALVMIFINHMPGNPYEKYTIGNWGFSDAAEGFFIMSGIAAGVAYAKGLEVTQRVRAGLWPGVAPIWRRAWTLYLVHLFLTVCVIAIFGIAAAAYGMPDLLQMHNLGAVFERPEDVLYAIPLLGHQIGYVNILPVYCVLLLFTPAAILMGLRRPMLLLGVSVALWFGAGWWQVSFANFPEGGVWFFNPLSWQLIFVIGLLIGMRLRRGARLVPRSRWLFGLASAFLLFVIAWKYQPDLRAFMNHQLWRLWEAGAPFHVVSHEKSYLALPRLLHSLALVYVLSCMPVVVRFSESRAAAPLRLMGQHGLVVFAAGTLISLGFQTLIHGFGQTPWLGWILPPAGLAMLLATACVAQGRRQQDGGLLPSRMPPLSPFARRETGGFAEAGALDR
ncbi:OpgC family protein [Tropicimonas aquimaris]|uniref:OpgC family protein n=1 Tax=Tropicimonas aquimaris TaxID=914152 RepID=A0ABW3INF8_9RHOB